MQDQYAYVYQCLLDAVTIGDTAIESSAISNSYATMTAAISREFEVCAKTRTICRNILYFYDPRMRTDNVFGCVRLCLFGYLDVVG